MHACTQQSVDRTSASVRLSDSFMNYGIIAKTKVVIGASQPEASSAEGCDAIRSRLTRHILEIPTDRPTQVCRSLQKVESFPKKKKLFDFRKSLHVQSRDLLVSQILERQGLVSFVEQRDFDDPGIDDLINEEPLPTSGTRQTRSMSEDGAGIRTRPIKCEHTVKHYFFIIGSAEALPILCVRFAQCERERERERERDGSDVIVTLKLAMSFHFPLQKIRTWVWVYTFPCQKFALFFLPSHFPCNPSYIVALKFRNEFSLFVAKKFRPLCSDSLKWRDCSSHRKNEST